MSEESHLSKWWFEDGPESPSEWNFDSLPDSELIACCYWEYARESETIYLCAGVRWCQMRFLIHEEAYKQNLSLLGEHNEQVRRIEGWVKGAGFDYEEFNQRLWQTDYPFLGIYNAVMDLVHDSALPWLKLPQDLRNYLVKTVKDTSNLSPLRMASVGELEELWNSNSVTLSEIRSRVRGSLDDSEDFELYSESAPIESTRFTEGTEPDKVLAAFSIDYSRFTDNEIGSAISKWIKGHRPNRWKRPKRIIPGATARGRKLLEYRVALERLGLMRLLHWHSPGELRDTNPSAWQKYHHKESDFRREVREATKFFRALYPFLPETERPIHEKRLGCWMPEMQRIAERVKSEMNVKRGQ